MPKVAILITILDRALSPAACVEECQRQIDSVAAEGKYSFSVLLNDEGPEGFLRAREAAVREGAEFFLLIDCNLRLKEGAVASLLENSEFLRHKAVIAGTVAAPDKSFLYGGRTRRGRLIEPDPVIPVPCHLYDLSLIFVPESVFARLESPADFFRRSLLGYGYGAKVARADIPRVVAPGVVAEADSAPAEPDWRNPDRPLRERAKSFLHTIFRKPITLR